MKNYIHLNRHINEAGVFNKIKKHKDIDDDGISKEMIDLSSRIAKNFYYNEIVNDILKKFYIMLLDDPNFGDIKNDDVLLHNDITLLNPAIRDLTDTKKFLLDSNNKDIFTNILKFIFNKSWYNNLIKNNEFIIYSFTHIDNRIDNRSNICKFFSEFRSDNTKTEMILFISMFNDLYDNVIAKIKKTLLNILESDNYSDNTVNVLKGASYKIVPIYVNTSIRTVYRYKAIDVSGITRNLIQYYNDSVESDISYKDVTSLLAPLKFPEMLIYNVISRNIISDNMFNIVNRFNSYSFGILTTKDFVNKFNTLLKYVSNVHPNENVYYYYVCNKESIILTCIDASPRDKETTIGTEFYELIKNYLAFINKTADIFDFSKNFDITVYVSLTNNIKTDMFAYSSGKEKSTSFNDALDALEDDSTSLKTLYNKIAAIIDDAKDQALDDATIKVYNHIMEPSFEEYFPYSLAPYLSNECIGTQIYSCETNIKSPYKESYEQYSKNPNSSDASIVGDKTIVKYWLNYYDEIGLPIPKIGTTKVDTSQNDDTEEFIRYNNNVGRNYYIINKQQMINDIMKSFDTINTSYNSNELFTQGQLKFIKNFYSKKINTVINNVFSNKKYAITSDDNLVLVSFNKYCSIERSKTINDDYNYSIALSDIEHKNDTNSYTFVFIIQFKIGYLDGISFSNPKPNTRSTKGKNYEYIGKKLKMSIKDINKFKNL